MFRYTRTLARALSRPSAAQAAAAPAVAPVSEMISPREDDVHDLYRVGDVIGQGSFGTVFSALHRASRNPVALKVQRLSTNKWCLRELEMMSLVNQQNRTGHCAEVLDAFIHDSTGSQADNGGGKEAQRQLVIAQPLYDGPDLYDYLTADGPALSERLAFKLLVPMLSGIEECHRAGFAHLDAKPENFMFTTTEDGKPSLVLVDFGSAELFTIAQYAETGRDYVDDQDDTLHYKALDRIIGTARYISPEVAAGSFSSRSDVWSVGVCLFMMLTKEAPFELTARGEAPRFEDLDLLGHPTVQAMSPEGHALLLDMMNKTPAKRLSATEALARAQTILDSQA